jgi:tetratricopeptide (TPR) repeat protein
MSYLSKGDHKTSLNLLKRAEGLARGSEMKSAVLNNLGCYYKKVGKPRLALMYLEKARDIESKDPSAKTIAKTHLNYCAILSELGKHSEALVHVMKAVVMLQDEFLRLRLARKSYNEEKIEVLAVAYQNYAVELEFLQKVRAI